MSFLSSSLACYIFGKLLRCSVAKSSDRIYYAIAVAIALDRSKRRESYSLSYTLPIVLDLRPAHVVFAMSVPTPYEYESLPTEPTIRILVLYPAQNFTAAIELSFTYDGRNKGYSSGYLAIMKPSHTVGASRTSRMRFWFEIRSPRLQSHRMLMSCSATCARSRRRSVSGLTLYRPTNRTILRSYPKFAIWQTSLHKLLKFTSGSEPIPLPLVVRLLPI